MANMTLDLPLPVLNGPGAAIDTSAMGAPKTITVVGSFPGATIKIEASVDGGVVYFPVHVFQKGGPQVQIISFAANRMRINVSGRKSTGFSANVDVGAPGDTTQFASIVVPAGNGAGPALSIIGFDTFLTVVSGGSFPGAAIQVQISEDGIDWAQIGQFSGQGGWFVVAATASFIRAFVIGSSGGFGGTLAIGAVTGGQSQLSIEGNGNPLPGAPFDTLDFIGSGVEVLNAGGGEATIRVAGQNLVFRPGGIQHGNVYTSWTDLMVAKALIEGYKTIQFDDSIVTPCVIPLGVWDMYQTEWFGVANDVTGAFPAVSVANGASLPGFRKIGGEISVTNFNTVNSPVVVTPVGPAGRVIFELGVGLTGDFPMITQAAGTVPFFDCTGLAVGQQFLLRASGSLLGVTPAIQFGASGGSMALALFENRIAAGMIAGTNPAAPMTVSLLLGSTMLARQSAWAGTISRGRPNSGGSSAGLGGTPFVRTLMFPPPLNQLPAAPSPVALVPNTGLGMNVTYRLDASAGVIIQPLPIIRLAAPVIGAPLTTLGVINSEGMIVIIREFSGLNGVSLTPTNTPPTVSGTGDSFAVAAGIVTLTDAAALFTAAMVGRAILIAGSTSPANNGTFIVASFISPTQITYANAAGVTEVFPGTWIAGDTIEGGAGPLLVPAGGSRILQSDGISDWRIIGGYL